jgi:probable HAF family extracellular repeat protein
MKIASSSTSFQVSSGHSALGFFGSLQFKPALCVFFAVIGLPCSITAARAQLMAVDLGSLGGSQTYASSINSAGTVVGASFLAGNAEHAFSYKAGVMTDLNTLVSLKGALCLKRWGSMTPDRSSRGATTATPICSRPNSTPCRRPLRSSARSPSPALSCAVGSSRANNRNNRATSSAPSGADERISRTAAKSFPGLLFLPSRILTHITP